MALIALILFTLYPLVWMLAGSLKDTQEFYTNIWGLPEAWKWSNYPQAWTRGGLGGKYINSIIVTSVSLLLIIPAVGCAAYAIARLEFRFKRAIYIYLLLGLCIPTGVLAIPIFMSALQFGLIDSLAGMILFGSAQALAFGTFLLRSFFIALPKSLEEAAVIDGCTRFQSFTKIIVPLARPGIMALVVLNGITVWNEYLLARILIREDANMTLPLGMKAFVDKYVTDYPQLFAGLVTVTLPMLLVYIIAQRSFIEGMTAGSVK
ncbi:MAG: carbohydrate ABC transporter permease [Propionibacteriaceae bacterium]|nr:carbohydrate ABC transporter permease [Propionibacteriaceae bacterium]